VRSIGPVADIAEGAADRLSPRRIRDAPDGQATRSGGAVGAALDITINPAVDDVQLQDWKAYDSAA
jgi:hypothetical protein